MKEIKKGDIFWVELPPSFGSEQDGIRPALILQNNVANKYSPLVIVAPLTKQNKKNMPTHLFLKKEKYNLEYDSIVLFEQITTVDKSRVGDKISALDVDMIQKVNKKIKKSLEIEEVDFDNEEFCLDKLDNYEWIILRNKETGEEFKFKREDFVKMIKNK